MAGGDPVCPHRTISDWTSSNEKAVTSLLHTLEELKSELSTPSSSQVRLGPRTPPAHPRRPLPAGPSRHLPSRQTEGVVM